MQNKVKNHEQALKGLRQRIVATVKCKYPGQDHHDLLNSVGYGKSLTAISCVATLTEILNVFQGNAPQHYTLGKLDEQGRMAYAKMKDLGWSVTRLRGLMVNKCGTVFWMKLTSTQKRTILGILRSYERN